MPLTLLRLFQDHVYEQCQPALLAVQDIDIGLTEVQSPRLGVASRLSSTRPRIFRRLSTEARGTCRISANLSARASVWSILATCVYPASRMTAMPDSKIASRRRGRRLRQALRNA
jgi:hypothetical protein